MEVSKIRELLQDQIWMLKQLLKQTKPETRMNQMIQDFIWETYAELELFEDGDPE